MITTKNDSEKCRDDELSKVHMKEHSSPKIKGINAKSENALEDREKYSVYKQLLQEIADIMPSVKDDKSMRGNLAYFVWSYYGDPVWPRIKTGIDQAIEDLDVNRLCWIIVYANAAEFDCHLNLRRSEGSTTGFLQTWYTLQYRAGNLRRFDVILDSCYPAYFYMKEGNDGFSQKSLPIKFKGPLPDSVMDWAIEKVGR